MDLLQMSAGGRDSLQRRRSLRRACITDIPPDFKYLDDEKERVREAFIALDALNRECDDPNYPTSVQVFNILNSAGLDIANNVSYINGQVYMSEAAINAINASLGSGTVARRTNNSTFESNRRSLGTTDDDCDIKVKRIVKINDNFDDDCFTSVLEKMREENFDATVKNILSNFDLNNSIELEFENSDIGPPSLDGEHRPQRLPNEYGDGGSYAVTLNNNALTGASQEYIAVTIMHEVIHAYFTSRPSFKKWRDAKLDHDLMAVLYIAPLVNMLNTLYNLDKDVARSLAWGGLGETVAYSKLTVSEKNKIINDNNSYKNLGGTRSTSPGTNCP